MATSYLLCHREPLSLPRSPPPPPHPYPSSPSNSLSTLPPASTSTHCLSTPPLPHTQSLPSLLRYLASSLGRISSETTRPLYSFNIAILSTLPLTKGTAPAPIEKLHYQSHLQLHVNPHLGTPPLPYTPQIHLEIEEDDHHVEGRLGGNRLQPDF